MSVISDNIAALKKRMKGQTLIAVSKSCSAAQIEEALKAGQRSFGENRVQEAMGKFPSLRTRYKDIDLHLIGPLQSNKAQMAVELFDAIQSLDRPSLAKALARAIAKTGRKPRLYIEVNIGDEPQKAGVSVDDVEAFYLYCRKECGLSVSGLMCIPPQDQDPRPFFKRMRKLADKMHLAHLSMGMSKDYESALECGATEVRIGTAIFGPRR